MSVHCGQAETWSRRERTESRCDADAGFALCVHMRQHRGLDALNGTQAQFRCAVPIHVAYWWCVLWNHPLNVGRSEVACDAWSHRPSPVAQIAVARWASRGHETFSKVSSGLEASLLDEKLLTNAALTWRTVGLRKLSSQCEQQQGARANMASTSSLIIFRCLQVG